MRKVLLTASALCALTLCAAPAHAAFITWDDSDPNTITITAGDFEAGFSVDGNLLTTGLGNSGSITLPDTGHTFSGSWIDLGLSSGAHNEILFALAVDPTAVTSGAEWTPTTDGFFGTITGSFGGFNGSTYFFTSDPTFLQNGQTVFNGEPFLSISFTSEAPAVPEPAMLLMGVPGAAYLLRRRARR
jgi:hypothetical protein